MPVETPLSRRWVSDPAVLAVTAVGGIVGAEARYALSVAWSHGPGSCRRRPGS